MVGSLLKDDLFIGVEFVDRSSIKIDDILCPSVCSLSASCQSWLREEGLFVYRSVVWELRKISGEILVIRTDAL